MNFTKTTIIALFIGAASFVITTKQFATNEPQIIGAPQTNFNPKKSPEPITLEGLEKEIDNSRRKINHAFIKDAIEVEKDTMGAEELKKYTDELEWQRLKKSPILQSGYYYDNAEESTKEQTSRGRIHRHLRDSGYNIPTTMDND